MVKERVFLAGDSAHSYTPAGGFGMNCGLQDINQLIHTIDLLERNPSADRNKVCQMYNHNRLAANHKYLQKSMENYEITEQAAQELGFPPQLTDYYFRVCKAMPTSLIPSMKLT